MDDGNVSAGTGRGCDPSEHEGEEWIENWIPRLGGKHNGTARQASETASSGVEASGAEVEHCGAVSKPIFLLLNNSLQ